MVTIILGLIAAIGLGGGIAVVSHNSGHGHESQPAIVETINPAANLNPNYELISALTDPSQYELTLATDSGLAESLESQVSGLGVLGTAAPALPSIDDPRYGNPEDDLANGEIHGNLIGDTGIYSILAFKQGLGLFAVLSGRPTNEGGSMVLIPQVFTMSFLTNPPSLHSRYWTFTQTDPDLTIGSTTYKHYNSLHLGGAALGLTVADFGHWEERGWKEDDSGNFQSNFEDNAKTFFFFDERFAYRGHYHRNTVPMQGNVLVSTLTDKSSATPYDLQTGSISFTLDLAHKAVRDGTVVMDQAAYQEVYNVSGFSGTIYGSVFTIDGTGWQGTDPVEGQLRGGVGKILIGKYGIEAVGNFTKQIEGTEESGKADYTFGAREN